MCTSVQLAYPHIKNQYIMISYMCEVLCTTTGTRETMCSSLRKILTNIQTHPRLSGKCNVSDDCLTTECDVAFSLGLVKINSTMKITLMPCTEPYAIRLQASLLGISTHIDGVFTKTTVIQVQVNLIPLRVIISITQTDTGIILGVSTTVQNYIHTVCTIY